MRRVRRATCVLGAIAVILSVGFDVRAQTPLRIVTWNMQQDSNWSAKADYIASLQPDIVVIQEINTVLLGSVRTRIDNGSVHNNWDYRYHSHLNVSGSDRGEGNAVFTHLTIDNWSPTRLVGTDPYTSQRAVVRVQVTVNSVPINVYSVHLATTASARQSQVNQFIQWARGFAGPPQLVGGDFNATPDQPDISSATQPAGVGMAADYRDLWGFFGNRDDPGDPGFTHSSTDPDRRIDYWFQSLSSLNQVQHVAIEVLNDQAISDHFAVQWDVTVGGGSGGGSTPFYGSPFAVPGAVIQAEDFDHGGQNVAYLDDTPTNRGGAYRTEAVDIEPNSGGFNISYFSDGEWLKYTIDVAMAGTYRFEARVASSGAGGTFHVESNGVVKSGPITVPNTGGWHTWQPVSADISLDAGVQVLRLYADTAGPVTTALGNLDAITLTPTGETVLLADTFGGTSLDTAKWSEAVMSGTRDPNVDVNVADGRLNIGPLLQLAGSHANGILSQGAFNLTGAYASVQWTARPSEGTGASMSLTLPLNAANHYRIETKRGELWCERKVADVKTHPCQLPLHATDHAFWRIRHDGAANMIRFETAPNNAGSPGVWTVRGSASVDFNITALRMELKAGTWALESTPPGTAAFDNFKLARPPQ